MRHHTRSRVAASRNVGRRWLAWASLILGAIALSSCASNATATPTPTPSTPAAVTADPDLHTPPAQLSGAGSTFDEPFFTPAFAAYHRLNPGSALTTRLSAAASASPGSPPGRSASVPPTSP